MMTNQAKPKSAVEALRKAATLLCDNVFDDPCVPTDIRELAYHSATYLRWLADWHYRERDDSHSCGGSYERMCRMMLALAERDENAYEIVVFELGDCKSCWNSILRLAMVGATSHNMLRVGGADKLGDEVAAGLERTLMSTDRNRGGERS